MSPGADDQAAGLAGELLGPVLTRALEYAPPGQLPNGRVWCFWPWYSLQHWFTGEIGPCCLMAFPGSPPPTTREELMAAWNSPHMVALRERLVRGEVQGTPCEYCYQRIFDTHHQVLGMGRTIPAQRSGGGPEFRLALDRANEAYASGAARLEHTPLDLYFFASPRCNLRCAMCRQSKEHHPLDPRAALDVARLVGWPALDRFGVVGGEVFFNEDGLAIQNALESEPLDGARVFYVSNGQLLEPQLQSLARLENLLLVISVDGTGPVYESVRRGARWERLLRVLDALAALRRTHPAWTIRINSIVMKSTAPCLEELMELAAARGFDIFFTPVFGQFPEENLYLDSSLLERPQDFPARLEAAGATARRLGLPVATDTLEKLRGYLGHVWALRGSIAQTLEGQARVLATGAGHAEDCARALCGLLPRRDHQIDAFCALADALLDSGAARPALELARVGLERHPRTVALLTRHAAASVLAGMPDHAKRSLDEALALAPDSMGGLYAQTLLLAARGQTAQAVQAVRRALDLGLRNPRMAKRFLLACPAGPEAAAERAALAVLAGAET